MNLEKKDIFIILICICLGGYIFKTSMGVNTSSQMKRYDAGTKISAAERDSHLKTSDAAANPQTNVSTNQSPSQVNSGSSNAAIKRGANITRNFKVPVEIYSLPLLAGTGLVDDLDIAMAKDPVLRKLVEKLSQGQSLRSLYDNFDQLMAQWAGVSDIPDNAMRGAYSAKKVAIMEKFYNDPYVCEVNGQTTTNVPSAAVPSLRLAYMKLKSHFFADFALQTVLDSETGNGQYSLLEQRFYFFSDRSKFPAIFAYMVNNHSDEDLFYLAKVINVVSGGEPSFKLSDLRGRISVRQFNMLTNPYAEVNPIQPVFKH